MTMDTSKLTSKTSSLKALLLRAWKERWSDVQWGIYIKTVLPRGVSGDVYNLAECILQQALIGPGPNQLVLSYLRHSLSSQLISHGAVLQSISKYQGFHKSHCIISLLNLLQNIQKHITCHGKPEDCIALSMALLSVVHWLLMCVHHALKKLASLQNSPEHSTMLEMPLKILTEMLGSDFSMAMLYLAKHEDKDLHQDIFVKCKEVDATVTQGTGVGDKEQIEKITSLVRRMDPTDKLYAHADSSPELLAYSLHALITFEALLNPNSDMTTLVDQLLLIQNLKGYSLAEIYCEILRACFMGLGDAAGSNMELKWGAFTFLKVPHVLHCISKVYRGESSSYSGTDSDIIHAFELLLQYGPLLDITDTRYSCNSMEFLLKELLNKTGLISETEAKQLLAKRENSMCGLQKLDQTNSQAGNICLILRAEPTVATILKTLDTDYAKKQDALLGVLCHMMSGKSFELILAAAAATGKLQTFATTLIKCNDCSKQISGENSKASQTRAMLFDISFLMLCHIVQTYGSEVWENQVIVSGETEDLFFEQWVVECMMEGGRSKSPDQTLKHCDASKVDLLLAQFNSPDSDIKTSLVKWHEVCLHAPAAIKEVLLAWERGALSTNEVKRILDTVRSKMCCLPVCVATWLCSYIQTLHHDALLKPMNMIQHFQTALTEESDQEYFKERSGLMSQIIKKMWYDVVPPGQSKLKALPVPHIVISKQSASELLQEIWLGIHQRGWVDLKATHSLESLLSAGGPQWFVTALIKEALVFLYQQELDSAVDLVFSIFHLDIEQCTLALLMNTLPQYLYNLHKTENLTEPQGSALARLSVCCIFAAIQFKQSSKTSKKASRKRTREFEYEDFCDSIEGFRHSKYRRLTTQISESEDSALALPCTDKSGNTSVDALTSAILGLFRGFLRIAQDPDISQQTHFVFNFLEYAVRCGKDKAKMILQYMPTSLVLYLLKSLPNHFTMELILKLYDIQTAAGRKAIARVLCMLKNLRTGCNK